MATPSGPPPALRPIHLTSVLVPATTDDGPPPTVELDLGIARLETLSRVLDALRIRLPMPSPAPVPHLADYVQQARLRLRATQLRVDTDEVLARGYVLRRVRAELSPAAAPSRNA